MMFKKLSSLLCVVLITASFAITCLAQPATENGIGNNGVGTLLTVSLSAKAAPGKQTYSIEIDGNDAIGTEEQTYMTFVVTDNEGKELELQLRISKNDSGVGVIKIANKIGNRVFAEQHPYIASSRIKLDDNETGFEIVVKNNALEINKQTCIENVKSIRDVEVVWGNDRKTESTTASTSTSPSTAPANNKLDTNELTDKNENTDSKDNQKTSFSKIIIIAIVAVAVLGAVGFIVIRKHKVDTEPQFEHKHAIKLNPKKKIKDEIKTSKNDIVSINKTKTSIQEHNNFSRIPVGISEPIRHTVSFEYEKTSGSTEEVVTNEPANSQAKTDNQSVVDVLLGNTDSSSLPETCFPLLLMNSYDLSISDLMAPSFKVSSDKKNAKYVVVDDEKLYINPLKYNGDNFKAYSGLTCLDKCFTIMCDYNEVKPQGQKIISIEPAILQKTGNDYILVKKGLLNVE